MEAVKEYVTEKMPGVPKPEASCKNLDLKGVATDGVNYLLMVSVINPYPTAIPVCQIDYLLKSEGRVIASGDVKELGSMTARDTTVLEVPLKVPHSVVASLVKDILFDSEIKYEINLLVIIDLPVVGTIKIPINSQGKAKVPSIKDYFKGGNDQDNKDKDEEDKVKNEKDKN